MLFICCCCSVAKLWLNSNNLLQPFATPWTAARQAPLSSTILQSLLKFMSIELVMLSNYLIFCRPLLLLPSIFPSIRVFSSESALCIRWISSLHIGASALASVFPMTIQGWFYLGLTGWIPCSPRASQESSPTPQFKNINSLALSLLYGPTHMASSAAQW